MKLLRFALVFSILFTQASFGFDSSAVPRLPGAPQAGSAEDQADSVQVLDFQKSRTAADCTRAGSEVNISLASYYGAPYGPLTALEVSKWKNFLASSHFKVSLAIGQAKNRWKRARPYDAHSEIAPCIRLERSYSYPSGHSALAEFDARVLVVAFPNRAKEINARAKQIAMDRAVGGVHYPSDVRDGMLLGDQVYDDQNQDGQFEQLIREQF